MQVHQILPALLLIPAVLRAAVVIDDFRSGSFELTAAGSLTQENLPAGSVLGGRRAVQVSKFNQGTLLAKVDATSGGFSFTGSDFGYFSLGWSMDADQRIDLRANGATAFRLDFNAVDPALRRGIYTFSVDGVAHDISLDLFRIDGYGTIDIPFSAFTSTATFTPREIRFEAARVEPDLRLGLASITTVPEPGSAATLAAAACLATVGRRRRSR